VKHVEESGFSRVVSVKIVFTLRYKFKKWKGFGLADFATMSPYVISYKIVSLSNLFAALIVLPFLRMPYFIAF